MSVIAIKTTEGESTVKSGTLTAEAHEILYLVSGAKSRAEAFAAVDSAAPAAVDKLVKKQLRFERFTGNDMEVSAIYGEAIEDSEDPGVLSSLVSAKAKVSFDTSGGTQHIVSGRNRTMVRIPAGKPAIDPWFSIGWNGKTGQDAEYAGVDIVVPNTRKVVTQTIRKPTTIYENTVIDLTGTVNGVKFLGREPGEVLFLGASWSDEGASAVPATYNFAIRKNETRTVHGEVISKKGWQYLWDIVNTTKSSATSPVQVTALGIFLSDIYEETDFRLLGIRV